MSYISNKFKKPNLLIQKVEEIAKQYNLPTRVFKNTIDVGRFYSEELEMYHPLISLSPSLNALEGEIVIPGEYPYKTDILKEVLDTFQKYEMLTPATVLEVHISIAGIHIHIRLINEELHILNEYLNILKKHFKNLNNIIV